MKYRLNKLPVKTTNGFKINELHNVLAIKVIMKKIMDCYQFFGLLHLAYKSLDEEFNDYIGNPKTTMYQSIHTSLFITDDRVFQTRIRTKDMDLIANRGVAAYWDLDRENAKERMQSAVQEQLDLSQTLKRLDTMYSDDAEFLDSVKTELFSPSIFVRSLNGKVIELPA